MAIAEQNMIICSWEREGSVEGLALILQDLQLNDNPLRRWQESQVSASARSRAGSAAHI